jgi:transcriptional regulator with XRE-family HTH domain
VAENIKGYRLLRGMTQEEVGLRMSALGQAWNAGTAGFVERTDRALTVDEVAAVAVVLGVSIPELFDPSGPDGRGADDLDLGGGAPVVVGRRVAALWLRDRALLNGNWDGQKFTQFVAEGRSPADQDAVLALRLDAAEQARQDRARRSAAADRASTKKRTAPKKGRKQ